MGSGYTSLVRLVPTEVKAVPILVLSVFMETTALSPINAATSAYSIMS